MEQSRPLFVYFHLFHTTQFKYKLIKAFRMCLGLEPRAAEWQAHTNPLSYGGTDISYTFREAFKQQIFVTGSGRKIA